jgi:hypothetical protein
MNSRSNTGRIPPISGSPLPFTVRMNSSLFVFASVLVMLPAPSV